MGFFDLNIPYLESDKLLKKEEKSSSKCKKTSRLKLIIKAMELGYTGIAYNRTIKGVISDSDRCSISLFPLSSVLNLAPSLSSSVKLHRQLLNLPYSTPFRQYTRLTLIVDTPSQASALNSGNPILRTYDIVAIRPLNQNAFEQACQASEVDLIAIDFSEKLPFRLKQPMVKAAIGRGVYFEITYSSLLMDAQVRRQMISNAKLLVDWTRGKNLIFSSAAPSVTELRGPYDVANLSSLLGLTMERAKATISKNCRSLITNASRKKQCYKEAIRVEVVSSGEQFDSKEPWFGDWLKWDSISSGEGDLLLDDMEKSFSATNKASKTVKAIDFASAVNSLPSNGLLIRDLVSVKKVPSEPPDIGKNLSAPEETGVAVGVSEHAERLNLLCEEAETSLRDAQLKHQSSCSEDSKKLFSAIGSVKDFIDIKEIGTHTNTAEEEPKISNGLDVYLAPTRTEMDDLQSQSCTASFEAHLKLANDEATVHCLAKVTEIDPAFDDAAIAENSTLTKDINLSALQSEKSKRSSSVDVVLGAQDVAMDEVLIGTDIRSEEGLSLISCDVSLHEGFPETEQLKETGDVSASLADGLAIVESNYEMKDTNDYSVENHGLPEEVAMEEQKQIDHAGMNYASLNALVSGKGRRRHRTSRRAFVFPFKHLLKPISFKKTRQFKNKTKMHCVSFAS